MWENILCSPWIVTIHVNIHTVEFLCKISVPCISKWKKWGIGRWKFLFSVCSEDTQDLDFLHNPNYGMCNCVSSGQSSCSITQPNYKTYFPNQANFSLLSFGLVDKLWLPAIFLETGTKWLSVALIHTLSLLLHPINQSIAVRELKWELLPFCTICYFIYIFI